MKLDKYLEKQAWGYKSILAEKLGITPTYLSMLLRGMRKPSLELAMKIQYETDRKVTVKDLIPDFHKKYKL